jgi:hypothetical protein
MALQPRPDGSLEFVAGASRTGKTLDAAIRTERQRRLLVWDCAKREWGTRYNCRAIRDPRELARACAPGAPIERIAYQVEITRASFDYFCRCAWLWLRVARGALIVDELADVTSPGKAPPAWGTIVRTGLAYGPQILAITQRPAESDKTALGNATRIRCFQLGWDDDEQYLAKALRCDRARVAALKPLQYLERDRVAGTFRAGSVKPRTLAGATGALPSAAP